MEAVGEPVVGQHPGHAHEHEHEDHRQREQRRLAQPFRRHPADDAARLQSHEQESQHVEQEDRGVPDREAVDARPGTGGEAGAAGDGHREGDEAENGRELEPLGDDPDTEGADELEEVAAERPCDEGRDEAAEEEREEDAEEHAARHRDGDPEREGGVAAALVVDRSGGGEEEQRRGVVEQALALQHRDHPASAC